MPAAGKIQKTAPVSEFRKDIFGYLEGLGDDDTLMILSRSKPVAYILSPQHYISLIETIQDIGDMLSAIQDFEDDDSKFADAEDFFKENDL